MVGAITSLTSFVLSRLLLALSLVSLALLSPVSGASALCAAAFSLRLPPLRLGPREVRPRWLSGRFRAPLSVDSVVDSVAPFSCACASSAWFSTSSTVSALLSLPVLALPVLSLSFLLRRERCRSLFPPVLLAVLPLSFAVDCSIFSPVFSSRGLRLRWRRSLRPLRFDSRRSSPRSLRCSLRCSLR